MEPAKNSRQLSDEQILEFISASKNMSAGNIELSGDALEKFKEVLETRRPDPSTPMQYNPNDDPTSADKQKVLEEFMSEIGCCYLGLVTASDTILRMSLREFGLFLVHLRTEFGKFPESDRVSIGIAENYALFKHAIKEEQETVDSDTQRSVMRLGMTVQEEMLDSGARFKLQETSTGFHVAPMTFGPCECPPKEVLCDHGWAARYVLCAIIKRNRFLGGTQFNFEDFLNAASAVDDSDNDSGTVLDLPAVTAQLDNAKERLDRLMKVKEDLKKIEEIRCQTSREMRAVDEDITVKFKELRHGNLDERGREILADQERKQFERQRRFYDYEETERVLKAEVKKMTDEQLIPQRLNSRRPGSTIVPDDSVTQIGDRNMKGAFLREGTVITSASGRVGRSNLGKLVNFSLPDVPESAIGFVQTEDTYAGDVAARQSVVPINGLSKPFSNSRLNLLGHVYTGLNIVTKESEDTSFMSMLSNVRKSKLNSPPVQLFRQLLNCTFDWEEGNVKSNPFNLPYIEVGMSISEDSLIKCFNLLNSEYRNLWFSELKQMQVPSFAHEFDNLCDYSLKGKGRSKSSSGSKTSESSYDDKWTESGSQRTHFSSKESKERKKRKDSNSSTRSSILGFR